MRREGRRESRRFTPSGGAPPPTPVVYGLNSFDATNQLGAGTSSNGIRGSTSGFTVRYLASVDTQAVGSAVRRIGSCTIFTTSGWLVHTTGTNAALAGSIFSTGGSAVSTPSFTITAGMVGKLLDVWLVYDQPGAKVRLYVNGSQVGTGTAFAVTYGVPASTIRHCFGSRTGSEPATDLTIYACEGADNVVADATIVANEYAAAQSRVAAGLSPYTWSSATHRWEMGAAWNPPTTIEDSISGASGDDMTVFAGAASGLSHVANNSPTWA